ncbi:MAG: DUF4402 domain-containing protein [Micavibrio sp.]
MAFVVSLGLIFPFQSAQAVTDDGTVDATIVSASTPALNPTDELNFGEIISGPAGTVVVDTAGTPTPTGVSLVPSSGVQQGVIQVIGTPLAVVNINMVAPSYTVSNGVQTMNVTGFDIGNGAGNPHAVTIGAGATVDVNIGGTLNVGAGQATGNYTGTFTLNADYQ